MKKQQFLWVVLFFYSFQSNKICWTVKTFIIKIKKKKRKETNIRMNEAEEEE